MKNLPKEKRDRIVLVAVGSITLMAAIWMLLIRGQQQSLRQVRQTIVEQHDKISNAERLLANSTEVESKLSEEMQRLKTYEEGMASGDLYSWLILTLNKFKAPYEVEIPQFSRELPTDVGMFANFPYKAAVFNVRGTAYYHDFGKFVAGFENAFPFIRVQNVELEPTPAQGTQDHEKLNFRMEIVTLIKPPQS